MAEQAQDYDKATDAEQKAVDTQQIIQGQKEQYMTQAKKKLDTDKEKAEQKRKQLEEKAKAQYVALVGEDGDGGSLGAQYKKMQDDINAKCDKQLAALKK